ncbi:MAG: ribonuclease P protein component, partial [Bacteroidota bacterium]
LFEQEKSLYLYPIRFIYLPCSAQVITNHQALFAVSKKQFKSTVVRNKIKRRLREAHRLHKYLLATRKSSSVYFLMGYIYIGSSPKGNFQTIQKKVITAINHLKNIHEKALLQ